MNREDSYDKRYELRYYNTDNYVVLLNTTDLKYIYQYMEENGLNFNNYDLVSIQISTDFLYKSKRIK